MSKIFCVVVGTGSVFSVKIDPQHTVDDLKRRIAKQVARCKYYHTLKLFLARDNAGRWLNGKDADYKALQLGDVPEAIQRLMHDDLAMDTTEDLLHYFGKEFKPNRRDIHVLVACPDEPVDPRRPPKRRKLLTDLKNEITPLAFTRSNGSNGWASCLGALQGQIECHRFPRQDEDKHEHGDADADGHDSLPLVLLCETFARFDHNCKHIDIDNKDCEFAITFCDAMSDVVGDDETLTDRACQLLSHYILGDRTAIDKGRTNGCITHGSYFSTDGVLLLSIVCRLEKGDGDGDPSMQNLALYLNNLSSAVDRQLPCFLVDICGPLLSVFGVVNTGDATATIEPLVASYPLLLFDNDDILVPLVRVCASLKTALHELEARCEDKQSPRDDAGGQTGSTTSGRLLRHLRFPYKDSYVVDVDGSNTTVTLRYHEAISRYVFVAQMQAPHQEPKLVIVKFAKRYGVDVHEHCAKAHVAPALYHHEVLPSGWTFVVMEKLPLVPITRAVALIAAADGASGAGGCVGDDGRHTDDSKDNVATVHQQLRDIEKLLADASFVHGDLRESNVQWDTVEKRVVLLDFDWSGRDGETTYPPFMHTKVEWPEDAQVGRPLRVAHDAHWLQLRYTLSCSVIELLPCVLCWMASRRRSFSSVCILFHIVRHVMKQLIDVTVVLCV